MKNILNKEKQETTKFKTQLLIDIISTIFWSFIVFLLLNNYSEEIIAIYNMIEEGKITSLECTIIIFVTLLLFNIITELNIFFNKKNDIMNKE